jgi:MoaA/NifB/PqqE/SkfB family radical SAM enzyme
MNKRLEIYIGFKCNNDCVFCVEYARRQKFKDLALLQNENEVREVFTKFKQQGYDHLNILGGEPFLQPNIAMILKLAKEYRFLVAVTNNGSLLGLEEVAKNNLPYIDDLILSIHGHNQELVTRQSKNPKLYGQLLKAFINIKKYFSGRLLKSNTVINSLNYKYLLDIVKFIEQGGINEMSLTSMSIDEHNKPVIVKYGLLAPILKEVSDYAKQKNIKLRFSDIPFCFLGSNYYLANNLYFDDRQKYDVDGKEVVWDREKVKTARCEQCICRELCQGLDKDYYQLYGDKELKAILDI